MTLSIDSIRADEWELLAEHAGLEAWAYARTGDEVQAADASERSRAFKEMAAREERDQSEYEEAKTLRLYRESVTLPDIEDLLREAGQDDELDGVTRLAVGVVLAFLGSVYADYTGEPITQPTGA